MTRRKPIVGETIRVKPEFGDAFEATACDILSVQFTVYGERSDKPVFLFYDPLKGPDWEYTT